MQLPLSPNMSALHRTQWSHHTQIKVICSRSGGARGFDGSLIAGLGSMLAGIDDFDIGYDTMVQEILGSVYCLVKIFGVKVEVMKILEVLQFSSSAS